VKKIEKSAKSGFHGHFSFSREKNTVSASQLSTF